MWTASSIEGDVTPSYMEMHARYWPYYFVGFTLSGALYTILYLQQDAIVKYGKAIFGLLSASIPVPNVGAFL